MKLFFLSYVNRSGSSFLCQALSKYRDVLVFPEGDWLIDHFLINDKTSNKNFPAVLFHAFKKDPKLISWDFSDEEINTICSKRTKEEAFLTALNIFKNKNRPEAKILIFKKRDAVFKFKDIEKNISFVRTALFCIIRDPRAVFLSQKKSIDPYSAKPFNSNPLTTAYYWDHFVNNIFAAGCNIIKYEKLLNSYEETMSDLLQLLKINPQKTNLHSTYFDLLPNEQQLLHKDITAPPLLEKASKWQNELSDIEIFLIENNCRKSMKKFDYSMSSEQVPYKPELLLANIYYKFRIFFNLDKY